MDRSRDVLVVELEPCQRRGAELRDLLARAAYRVTSIRATGAAEPWHNGLVQDMAFESMCAAFLVGGPGTPSALLDVLRGRAPALPVLLVVEPGEPRSMLELLNGGVADFIAPPLSSGEVLSRLWRAERRVHERTDTPVQAEPPALIGRSPAFREVLEQITLLAASNATVLLEGETGTGKEVCARAIHRLGRRRSGPFVPLNCGAIPTELVENELFGHERSAYTGATSQRDGLVRQACGGTLFLDEVDCLPTSVQVKLLRLLQEREYRPLGAQRIIKADVRFIAATNADIQAAVREGRLRQDLYYRLDVLRVTLPPLRERGEDVLLLAQTFVERFARQHDVRTPALSAEAAQALMQHAWPGNVRELEHVVERALVLAAGRRSALGPEDLRLGGASAESLGSFRHAKAQAVERFERCYLERLLRIHGGNITHASTAACKNRRAFFELVRKHGIDASRFRPAGHGSAASPGRSLA
jgi:DNA-binding NtrC family response regulator